MQRFWLLFARSSGNGLPAMIHAPLLQARRCLDLWLREEKRELPERHRQRAAALIARYFANEEEVSDALILSFLRHYGGFGAVDLDDPMAVRQELKATLDRAQTPAAVHSRRLLWLSACTGMLVMAVVLSVLYLSRQTLTLAEQQALRQAVAARVADTGLPAATIWRDVKRDLGVTRYQDIRRWDYAAALHAVKAATPP